MRIAPKLLIGALWICLFPALQFSIFAQSLDSSNVDPKKWEQSIKAFELSDKTNSPPTNAVVFVGSSSIRIWTNLAQCFPDRPVINRGFGGSQIADSVRYVERIVLPYKPRAVVFYAGDNDLAGGKTPQQIRDDFKRFCYKVHWALPETKIFFISIKPCPARWKFRDKVVIANQLIKNLSKTEKELTFINIYHAMLDEHGKPREELFQKDGLHLNPKGYELWTRIIKPYLAGL